MQHFSTTSGDHVDTFADPSWPGRRIGVSTVLLGIGAFWLLAMLWLLARNLPERQVLPFFAVIAGMLVLAAYCSTRRDAWHDRGALLLWATFGGTLSIWMIGIMSVGWLVFPALLLEIAALISWPRPSGTSIVSFRGIMLEITGFLAIPLLIVPGYFLV